MLGAVCLALTLASCQKSRAVSVSGILLYAADSFGTPNGFATYDACASIEAQLWRTAGAGKWHGLAVYAGLPPESLSRPPLNARNFLVEIPLNDGENAFTLVGEPGPLTATDEYERFAVNLYFNGSTEAVPGLSGLFERYAAPMGSPLTPNRSHCIYSLALTEMQGKPDLVYDDGLERVTVLGASFLSQDRFDPEWKFDLVGPQRFGPSGTRDWIGVLRLFVEPSVSTVDTGAAPRAVVPVQPRSGGFAGAGMPGAGGFAPAVPAYGAGAPLPQEAPLAARPVTTQAVRPTEPSPPPEAHASFEEASEDSSSETPSPLPGTPSPGTMSPARSTASPPARTPSPHGSGSPSTPLRSPATAGTPTPPNVQSPVVSPPAATAKPSARAPQPAQPTPTPRRSTR